MISTWLLIVSVVVIGVMLRLCSVVQRRKLSELSTFTPLESGFATVSSTNTILSLQYLAIMILLLILDLELLFVVSLLFSGATSVVIGSLL